MGNGDNSVALEEASQNKVPQVKFSPSSGHGYAEPTYLREENGLERGFFGFEAFFCFGESRVKGEATLWEPRAVRRLETPTGTAVSLWPMMRQQAGTLRSSESTSGDMVGLQRAGEMPTLQRDGVRPVLQKPGERPTTQRATDPEKGPDTEQDWRWVDLAVRDPIPVADLHTSWRDSWGTVSCGGAATRQNWKECFS